MTFFFDVTTFAGTVAERLILQWSFATLVAHWTIKGVVSQQQFNNAFLSALHLISLGAHNLSFSNGGHATDHHHRPARTFDFNQTLTAHTNSAHTRVITETRNVITAAIGSSNNQFTFTSGNGLAVDRDRDGIGINRRVDTARLAFGAYEDWSALNSTFAGQGDPAAQQKAMRDRLSALPAGRTEVWVTHQVIMSGLTGAYPGVGEGFLVDRQGRLLARADLAA